MSGNYFRLQGYTDGTSYRQPNIEDVVFDVALSKLVCVCATKAPVRRMRASCLWRDSSEHVL